MDKNNFKELIEKIIAVKKEYDLELELMCTTSFSEKDGGFLGLRTFLIEKKCMDDLVNMLTDSSTPRIARVLRSEDLYEKNRQIRDYIRSFCNCDLDDEECNCKLPSEEEAEQWWWNKTFTELERRSDDLMKFFKIK